MRIIKTVLVIALTALTIGIVAAPAFAGEPSIPQLKKRLRHAKLTRQRTSKHARTTAADLATARAILAAATTGDAVPDPATGAPGTVAVRQELATRLMADGAVTTEEIAALQTRAARAGKVARRCAVEVQNLQRRIRRLVRIERWNRRSEWKPLIEIACRRYGVSRAGLHRMMMLESGGSRTAGSMYKGLFQYYPATWSGSWNPWRRHSIFDGWAQIRATAYAISRGMGPSQWPNTYPMAF